jgi:ATP-dependent Clp protease adaptor protein ClpS
MSDRHDPNRDGFIVQERKPKTRLERPRMYKVLLLNDDYTPMEFVVALLEHLFYMPREKAVQVMLHVHQKGIGVCGVFTRDIAETKVRQALAMAREHNHPLQCTMELE